MLKLGVADLIAKVLNTVIRYGFYSFWVWCCYKSIEALAGKATEANIVLNFLGKLSADRWVAYLLAGGATAWAFGERRLRRRKVAFMSNRLAKYEKGIDPKRSSSTLPPSGTTLEQDEQ